MALWEKQYKISFPDLGIAYDNLRITFNVVKDLSEQTNKAEIKIYNLNDANRAKIEKDDLRVDLFAGYKLNGGAVKIFTGNIVQVHSRDEGTDIVTKLTVADGLTNLRDSMFSLSFPPKTGGKVIIEQIANEMGLTVVFGEDVTLNTYENGYSFVGNGGDALDEVCASFGVSWSIQNNILQIVLEEGTTGKQGLVFSADSGLIGSPEKIVNSAWRENTKTEKKQRKTKEGKEKYDRKKGWKIKTLLAPSIQAGDKVKVESRLLTGWFRVEEVKHSGDSHGDTWLSEIRIDDFKENEDEENADEQ